MVEFRFKRHSWDEPNAAGISLEGGVPLFVLRLQARPGLVFPATIRFSDFPTAREVTTDFQVAPLITQDGRWIQASPEPIQQVTLTRPMLTKVGDKIVFSVEVQTVAGKRYVLEENDSLPTGQWTVVEALTGDGAAGQLTDESVLGHQKFYRIRVE